MIAYSLIECGVFARTGVGVLSAHILRPTDCRIEALLRA